MKIQDFRNNLIEIRNAYHLALEKLKSVSKEAEKEAKEKTKPYKIEVERIQNLMKEMHSKCKHPKWCIHNNVCNICYTEFENGVPVYKQPWNPLA